ncbi:Type 1 glutamine amidotransferase-like domain-containing protein [Rhodococcus sp. IEGM 1409]|uniref:Type 1 glutamine amidotransferase-like domain-containing protein n=1 Tax=Rhodococcus sp. IEGM 1409 TaxID=3047082 RepID=UPI0024B6B41F|nr:Type 1 glutamine amidotransferase-like domain-containing protein [Rhodococcus sp. IEGM 1409]MDI9900068.1 Type 1 glutamine amidotransferase-like domain-containing protein [Rhodococcus sp. IEGM 1409]
MPLLLLSLGIGAVPDFISTHIDRVPGEINIGYLNDASLPYSGVEFVAAERGHLAALGYSLTDVTASDHDQAGTFRSVLDELDAIYVAGGNTFVLMSALRRNGTGDVLVEKVRAGFPYIGSSAGSIITGPSIEPVSLMDDPSEAPDLADHAGLALVDTVVIPHSDGVLPPYPPELIARIKQTYETVYPLTFLNDDQALLVENDSPLLIASP